MPEPGQGQGRPPEAITEGRLAGTHRWWFEVLDGVALTPAVRRLRLTSPDLHLLAPEPGQDLMFAVPVEPTDGVEVMGIEAPGTTNRRYTIRGYVPVGAEPHVVVDVVLHGGGPGARWASAVRPGDVVEAVGPRGKVVPVDGANAHLFVADAAGAPAMLCMLESLVDHASARAVIVVGGADEVQPTTAPADRVEVFDATDEGAVAAALRRGAVPGVHAYLAGERRQVASWRAVLVGAGVAADAISGKAYWSAGRANAGHGEPAPQP
jgi:NADPH-dependent ferric siderophore reductase